PRIDDVSRADDESIRRMARYPRRPRSRPWPITSIEGSQIMGTRWHFSGENPTDRTIDSQELRRLAAEGKIRRTDWLRRSGTERWIQAAKVAGLFDGDKSEWYYIRDGREIG